MALIGVTDPIQQQEITQQIRNSYFSGKEAAQLAEREQQVARQQQIASYQSELAALNQEMNQQKQNLAESAWQQQYQLRLEQLRQKHFN